MLAPFLEYFNPPLRQDCQKRIDQGIADIIDEPPPALQLMFRAV